jgi:branched-chain amino acid aminotransferase
MPGMTATSKSWDRARIGSTVFDGARAFEGVMPDIKQHCERINHSAGKLNLKPTVSTETWLELVREGVARFDAKAELYIRPMYWARDGAVGGGVRFDPESTEWCLCIYEALMPKGTGFSVTMSPYRRPTIESMPVDAKTGGLYSNNSRALFEAHARVFDNCIMRDMLGNVAELANANLMIAKDGIVYTPIPNGTFLNGITRQRVIALLRENSHTVIEKTMNFAEIEAADEIFSVGNFAKVAYANRINERLLQPGPFFLKARMLYWAFAHS